MKPDFLRAPLFPLVLPILLLFAVDFLLGWTDKHGKALAVIVLALQVQLMGSLYVLRYMDLRSAGPDLQVSGLPELRYARENLPKDARLLTNLPTQAAWYSNRPAVNIPNRVEDALAMIGRHRLDYLLLSAHPSGELGRFPAWIPVLREDPRPLAVLGARVDAFPGRGALQADFGRPLAALCMQSAAITSTDAAR